MREQSLNVGLVSLWWPPAFGGGEQYMYRLARALRQNAIPIKVMTASASSRSGFNGSLPVRRLGHLPPPTHKNHAVIAPWRNRGPPYLKWCQAVATWTRQHGFSHLILNLPHFAHSPSFHRLLRGALRPSNGCIGIVHHEPSHFLTEQLTTLFAGCGNWEESRTRVVARLRRLARSIGAAAFDARFNTRQVLRPDFYLSPCNWWTPFIDLIEPVPKYVLHPRLNDEHPAGRPERLSSVDIGVINPLVKKGSLHVANTILHNRRSWTFRVLKAGWGREFSFFETLVGEALGPRPARVHIEEFVPDIRSFFRSIGVFMFPSRIEGYGMAAADALGNATPVVAADFPAVREAVGSGAYLVPYLANGEEWIHSLSKVLQHRATWVERARKQAVVLKARERVELNGFVEFLKRLNPFSPSERPRKR